MSVMADQTHLLKQIATVVAVVMMCLSTVAWAEIDGHGPDAWQVTGVLSTDVLNARMGPGTEYPVIDRFAANERGLQQVTCVPLLIDGVHAKLSQAEHEALPPRWCLMRSADLARAGWVAQRFITPDHATSSEPAGEDIVAQATRLVRELYQAQARADRDQGESPVFGDSAPKFFSADVVDYLQTEQIGAHPLYGAHDFDGEILRIEADPDTPMFRGMVTINVDYRNFDQPQRAVFSLRADPAREDAALRIFRIEHDGWALP